MPSKLVLPMLTKLYFSYLKAWTDGATFLATSWAATRLFEGVTRCNLMRATWKKKNLILLLQLLCAKLQEKIHRVSGPLGDKGLLKAKCKKIINKPFHSVLNYFVKLFTSKLTTAKVQAGKCVV